MPFRRLLGRLIHQLARYAGCGHRRTSWEFAYSRYPRHHAPTPYRAFGWERCKRDSSYRKHFFHSMARHRGWRHTGHCPFFSSRFSTHRELESYRFHRLAVRCPSARPIFGALVLSSRFVSQSQPVSYFGSPFSTARWFSVVGKPPRPVSLLQCGLRGGLAHPPMIPRSSNAQVAREMRARIAQLRMPSPRTFATLVWRDGTPEPEPDEVLDVYGSAVDTAVVDFDLPRVAFPTANELTEEFSAQLVDQIESQIVRLQQLASDIVRVTSLGELPVSVERSGATLRVHFPNSDADKVHTLMDDKEVTSGRIVEVVGSADAPLVSEDGDLSSSDLTPGLSMSDSSFSESLGSYSLVNGI